MTLRSYLQSTWPELLLVIAMAACLGFQSAQCMHIDEALATNVGLVVGTSALVVAWLHLSVRDRRSVAIGVPALALACVVAALAASGGNLAALFSDSYDNPLLVYPILVATSVAVFLLSRKQATTVLLGIGGCVFCGAVEFLYLQHLVAPTLVFMVACAAYLACKRTTKYSGDDFALGFQASRVLSALGLAAVAAAVACGAFFAVVAPLNPPTHELKLITRYYSLEEVHVTGYSEFLHQRDKNLDSKNTGDEQQKTDQENADSKKYQGSSQAQQKDDQGEQGGGGLLASNLGDPAGGVRYFQDHWWLLLLIPLAIAAAWIAVVAVRRHRRRKRLEGWRALPPRERAAAEYRHLRSVLEGICGVSATGFTPAEYARAAQAETESLERVGGSASFAELSATAEAAAYAGRAPSAEELGRLEASIALVPKRVLHRFGRFRYIRLFFKV